MPSHGTAGVCGRLPSQGGSCAGTVRLRDTPNLPSVPLRTQHGCCFVLPQAGGRGDCYTTHVMHLKLNTEQQGVRIARKYVWIMVQPRTGAPRLGKGLGALGRMLNMVLAAAAS